MLEVKIANSYVLGLVETPFSLYAMISLRALCRSFNLQKLKLFSELLLCSLLPKLFGDWEVEARSRPNVHPACYCRYACANNKSSPNRELDFLLAQSRKFEANVF